MGRSSWLSRTESHEDILDNARCSDAPWQRLILMDVVVVVALMLEGVVEDMVSGLSTAGDSVALLFLSLFFLRAVFLPLPMSISEGRERRCCS